MLSHRLRDSEAVSSWLIKLTSELLNIDIYSELDKEIMGITITALEDFLKNCFDNIHKTVWKAYDEVITPIVLRTHRHALIWLLKNYPESRVINEMGFVFNSKYHADTSFVNDGIKF